MASAKDSRSDAPPRRRLRLVAAAFAAVVLLAVAPAVLTARIPTYNPSPLAPGEWEQLASGDGWRTDRVETEDGVALAGLVRPAPAADAPWAMFLPGNGADELRKGRDYLSRLAPGREWGLAVFAMRGFDASEGTPEGNALIGDTLRVHRHLRERWGATTSRTHVIGFSFGAGLVIYLAAQLAEAGDPPPDVVVLSTEGGSLRWWMRNPGLAAHWRWPDLYDVRPLLAELHMPFLIVEGSADLFAPHELRQRLGAQASYLELPGGDHRASLERPEAIEAVRAFLTRPDRTAARPRGVTS
jgi:uncharacterized protein